MGASMCCRWSSGYRLCLRASKLHLSLSLNPNRYRSRKYRIGDSRMSGEKAAVADAAAKGAGQRQRSTIGFPYMDLGAAIEMASAIHGHAGLGDCDDDQLAAWTDQSAKASTFRVQVYAARMFGILEAEGGKHKLSE